MAQAPAKSVARKGATAATKPAAAGGAKAASAKTTKAQAAAGEEEDPEAAAAAAAEAAAAEAQKNEKLVDLKGRLTDTIHSLKEGDKKSAEQARLDWVEIGRALNEGRALFTKTGEKGNQTDEKGFGKWLVENGFDMLGQRPTRAGAAWLANVYDFKPGLYALFPTESVDGEPLRRSPRTLQAWVREQVHAAFQDAWEMDSDGIELAADVEGTKEQKKDAAKGTMPNIYAALREQMDTATGAVEDAQAKLKAAKSPAERKTASDTFLAVSGNMDRLQTRKAILDEHNEDEMLSLFIGWRPKLAAVAFKDKEPADAAAQLFSLLKTHEKAGEVYDALGDLVDQLLAKLAADGGAVDGEEGEGEGDDEPVMNDPEGDADFDASEEDFEIGEEDDDADFDADVDANFEEGEEGEEG